MTPSPCIPGKCNPAARKNHFSPGSRIMTGTGSGKVLPNRHLSGVPGIMVRDTVREPEGRKKDAGPGTGFPR